MSGSDEPGTGAGRRVELVRPLPVTGSTADHTVHLTGHPVAPGGAGAASGPALVAAALAYRELGWPIIVGDQQVSLNLDHDVDAVALVVPAHLAAPVAEVLAGRRCPPAALAHPALPGQWLFLAGERFGVPLAWPAGVHRITGTVLLPPTVTGHGRIRWVHPPRPGALSLCREIDLCAALTTVLHRPPPAAPTHF